MTSFKKMKLVGEDELQRFKEKQIRDYDPKIRTLAFLQSEMDAILNADSDLNAEEKLKLFQIAQNRYDSFKKQSAVTNLPEKKQTVEAPAEEEAPPEDDFDAAAEDADDDDLRILQFIPTLMREKAKQVLKIIKENPEDISYDSHNTVSLSGSPIEHSNFTDLFRSLYVKSRVKPAGQAEFVQVLKNLNVPNALISNKSLHKGPSKRQRADFQFIPSASSVSPPGQQPHVLHVYNK